MVQTLEERLELRETLLELDFTIRYNRSC